MTRIDRLEVVGKRVWDMCRLSLYFSNLVIFIANNSHKHSNSIKHVDKTEWILLKSTIIMK